MLAQDLIELELTLLKREVRTSPELLGPFLAEDFLEIPANGEPFDKATALSDLSDEVPTKFTQSSHQVRFLSEDVAMVIYKATIERPVGAELRYSNRCSIWKRNGDQWQVVFHQGTPSAPFKPQNPVEV
jgi:hypothetical protein